MSKSWLNQLQSLLGDTKGNKAGAEGLSKLLAPAALGGLAGVLMGNKSVRKQAGKLGKNALLIGGGAAIGALLWNQYRARVKANHRDEPQYGQQSAPPDARVRRLVQALVFAAKSDGHIDEREQQAIDESLSRMALGEEARQWIDQALAQPLDPKRLAQGVGDEEEALEIYTLSCAVIDIDHFMERSYLDALAQALGIPSDVAADLERELAARAEAAPARLTP
ncbi:tellurite resistance TerB family protein [Edwardsiella tarda]|uniref:Tellurite resistance TerB family protein n=2 Tax=Edwardsiella tarda TaxID=636 RepID=D4F287_EDWTA|nr:DUF533 domain-containing protein [Edwardsiella tarda]EFE24100.1 hypothetical protein EDWATA_00831 [Edwardsiella tarda ATCC 23685]UAL57329.1 DUF533 domain-containing protein [Edwardsiella tarda]UCP99617.1 DUF533 domain-containing protein [Edwardsiella tarda ATCC 15947 = NBRC 105688]UCQ17284.1 DUF533 domain-containing protein [Edwardsiella tarda]UCQ27076.1 DUF533 domain-containing protein [Edwardsiella tarda]